jgi:hypothetical protein
MANIPMVVQSLTRADTHWTSGEPASPKGRARHYRHRTKYPHRAADTHRSGEPACYGVHSDEGERFRLFRFAARPRSFIAISLSPTWRACCKAAFSRRGLSMLCLQHQTLQTPHPFYAVVHDALYLLSAIPPFFLRLSSSRACQAALFSLYGVRIDRREWRSPTMILASQRMSSCGAVYVQRPFSQPHLTTYILLRYGDGWPQASEGCLIRLKGLERPWKSYEEP